MRKAHGIGVILLGMTLLSGCGQGESDEGVSLQSSAASSYEVVTSCYGITGLKGTQNDPSLGFPEGLPASKVKRNAAKGRLADGSLPDLSSSEGFHHRSSSVFIPTLDAKDGRNMAAYFIASMMRQESVGSMSAVSWSYQGKDYSGEMSVTHKGKEFQIILSPSIADRKAFDTSCVATIPSSTRR